MRPPQEKQVIVTILESITQNPNVAGGKQLTGFLSMEGNLYDNSLMVVGRSVNAWADSWDVNLLSEINTRNDFINDTINSVTSNGTNAEKCPMRWVTERWGSKAGYNTAKSAFWRSIKNIVEGLSIADTSKEDWPSFLTWSNLYKVSPYSGGNPSNSLCSLQFEECKKLLMDEVKHYCPKKILFLTGHWALKFLDGAVKYHELPKMKQITKVGTLACQRETEIQFVVASHPQGKPQTEWVDNVLKSFVELNNK